MKKIYCLFALVTLCVFACGGESDPDSVIETPLEEEEEEEEGTVTVNYVADNSDFANPDRGFYKYSETRASNYTVLLETLLNTYATPSTSSGATYQTLNTLVFRYYVLDDFINTPISQEFLDNMQLDFNAVRNAGVKMIPRFTYTITQNAGGCAEGFICPPYGDASKAIILAQIQQLGPVLTANSDVITALQMGFIGTWGEQYYTDFFGDASPNDTEGKLLDENWQDRLEVLKALLDVTPKDIMIQVRYPQMKQRLVYGINAGTTVAALNSSEAFSETDKARVGFHNDCLFASADDFGTYEDYGNSSSARKTDILNLKPYFKDDSKYVIVGGETCSDGYSPENDCAPAGIADTDLRELHYTYLNADYNNEVNNDWVDGGCMDAIKRNLGYRFVLEDAIFPKEISVGESIEVTINLENIGYTSPVKKRDVKLILRNKANASITAFDLNTDVRLWFSETSLKETFSTSGVLAAGEYDVLLHIADTYETLKNRSEYSIRLANEGVWEEATGYNSLNHTIVVN